jgi:hypothetical protein
MSDTGDLDMKTLRSKWRQAEQACETRKCGCRRFHGVLGRRFWAFNTASGEDQGFWHVRKPDALAAGKQTWWPRTRITASRDPAFPCGHASSVRSHPASTRTAAMTAFRGLQMRRKTSSSLISHGTLLHFEVVLPTLKTESHRTNKRRKLRKQLSSKDL